MDKNNGLLLSRFLVALSRESLEYGFLCNTIRTITLQIVSRKYVDRRFDKYFIIRNLKQRFDYFD